MNTLTTAWVAELVLITYRGTKQTGPQIGRPIPRLALPSEYAATLIVYGALSLVPDGQWGQVAGLVGWGLVVATLLNLWDPAASAKAGKPVVKQTPTAKEP